MGWLSMLCANEFRGRVKRDGSAMFADQGERNRRFETAAALHRAGHLQKAAAIYEELLAADPQDCAALHRLGIIAYQGGQAEKAIALIARAIAVNDSVPGFHNHLGAIYLAMGRVDEAVARLRRAVALAPQSAEAHNNLGNALGAQNRFDEAASCFEQAAALAPTIADIPYNLGNTLRSLNRLGDAETHYRKAIALKPDYAQAHVNLGFALLGQGKFAEAGPEHDWRWKLTPPPSPLRGFEAPEWDGGASPDATILIHAEQGLGDTIEFCRFVEEAAKRCGTVIFEVQPPLRQLLAPLERFATVLAKGDDLPAFDAHCPLLSLPSRLGMTMDTLSPNSPYLVAQPKRASAWAGKLPSQGLRIGIVWQGNPDGKVDRGRSVPLVELAPLAKLPGVTLISLQKHHGLEQLAALEGVTTLGPDFDAEPFMDSAAVMEHLDLIVTSDTAIAHLAGALGRPVWLLLQYAPDWRWQLGTETSPFYPSMRLFRQEVPGDWKGPVTRLVKEARKLAAGTGQ
jgi:tetratricopeptide (TPR) repeat protein